EDRSRLPAGKDCAVVLRLVVRTSADKRQDLAGSWIERDQRGFGLAFSALREHRVDAGEAFADRVLRHALQVQVERRVYLQGLVRSRRQPRILLVERLVDVVDEVRRLGFERALDDDE